MSSSGSKRKADDEGDESESDPSDYTPLQKKINTTLPLKPINLKVNLTTESKDSELIDTLIGIDILHNKENEILPDGIEILQRDKRDVIGLIDEKENRREGLLKKQINENFASQKVIMTRLIEDKFRDQNSSVQDQLNAHNRSVQDQIKAQEKSVQEQISANNRSVQDQLNDHNRLVQDQIKAYEKSAQEQISANNRSVEDQLNAHNRLVQEQINDCKRSVTDLINDHNRSVTDLINAHNKSFENQAKKLTELVEKINPVLAFSHELGLLKQFAEYIKQQQTQPPQQ